MSQASHIAELAAVLSKCSHWQQSDPAWRAAYRERTGEPYAVQNPHIIARGALALLRIGRGVARREVQACNGIERYQGNGIWCGTWTEADDESKRRLDDKAKEAGDAIAARYGATVHIGGDRHGATFRLVPSYARPAAFGPSDDAFCIA